MRPHRRVDHHGVMTCACGFIPPASDPLSDNWHIGWRTLQDHIDRRDDHLCHHEQYGQRCLLPRGHEGIHRAARTDTP